MKVTFKKEILSLCVNRSLGCISTEKTYDVIAGILINTISEDKCQICAYDMEKGIKTIIDAKVEESGSVVINGSKLASMVRLLSDDVTIETNDQEIATISSGKSKFLLHYKSGENFPRLPELSTDRSFVMNQKMLKEMIQETIFAVSKDEVRQNLTGLAFEIKRDSVRIIACDHYRLAIRNRLQETELQSKEDEEILKFIIPGKTIQEVERILEESDENIRFSLTKKNVVLSFNLKYGNEFKETIMFSRLIDAEYIEYNRYILNSYKTFVNVQRSLLEDSLIKASLITEDKTQGQTKSNVKFEIRDDVLYISAVSINGKVFDEIAIEKTGDDIEIGFSCKYLLEILRATNVDNLKLSLYSPLMSMKIEDGDEKNNGDSFIYLALPMKMRENTEA